MPARPPVSTEAMAAWKRGPTVIKPAIRSSQAGVAEISVGRFTLAIVIGRAIRFFGLGFLALRFGDAAMELLRERGDTVAYGLIGFLLAALVVYVLWTKARARKDR